MMLLDQSKVSPVLPVDESLLDRVRQTGRDSEQVRTLANLYCLSAWVGRSNTALLYSQTVQALHDYNELTTAQCA